MPVNMDPHKRRKKPDAQRQAQDDQGEGQPSASSARPTDDKLETMTERDKELALADAEWKNLWEATEVIDMDRD